MTLGQGIMYGLFPILFSSAFHFIVKLLSFQQDELLWAASWLYLATGDVKYLQYVVNNAYSLGGVTTNTIEMSWDNKYIGVQVLMAKVMFLTFMISLKYFLQLITLFSCE